MTLQIKKRERSRPRAKGKQAPATKAIESKKGAKGTFGCRVGSRKEQIATRLATTGAVEATELAKELSIKASTLSSWLATWKRAGLWKPESEGGK